MMEDRIQVNGVWYVKETTKPISDIVSMIDIDEFDVTRSLHRIWEDSEYAFEAKILLAPDGIALEDTWGDCWLIITEKVGDTNDSWIEHSIDNPTWMLGVYEGDDLSMREAKKMMTPNGIAKFRGFLHLLIKQGWLKK
ncbi:MAG TPA: hypothetical protein DEF82_02790 [Crocinitomicaceae bacterium]|nr:hypothetical protein [Crocinitomicaceae bacterium]